MNVHVWYDVVSIFVNDAMCDWYIVSLGKIDTRVEIIRMFIVRGFDLSKEVSWLYWYIGFI